jgi:hypothetical protein
MQPLFFWVSVLGLKFPLVSENLTILPVQNILSANLWGITWEFFLPWYCGKISFMRLDNVLVDTCNKFAINLMLLALKNASRVMVCMGL